MHIGMIGGIGPAATEFYYRNLVKAHSSANKKLELTIVHAEASELLANIMENNPKRQAEIYLDLALRLKNAGAEIILITSIAGHFCMSEFEKISPLPVANIIPALETELTKRKLKRVGLLGHRISMESKLFGGLASKELLVPLGDNLEAVHDVYVNIASTGKINDEQRAFLFSKGKELCKKQGAEAIILAGTDLFLAFDGYDCGFNVIDSALVHIDSVTND